MKNNDISYFEVMQVILFLVLLKLLDELCILLFTVNNDILKISRLIVYNNTSHV